MYARLGESRGCRAHAEPLSGRVGAANAPVADGVLDLRPDPITTCLQSSLHTPRPSSSSHTLRAEGSCRFSARAGTVTATTEPCE